MKCLARHVTLFFTIAAILSLGTAFAKAEDIRLSNGKMIRIHADRAMMMGENGKPTPIPPGIYDTADGRMIKIGQGGSVEQIKSGGKKGKDKDKEKKDYGSRRVTLKNGKKALIDGDTLWILVNQHGGQEKAGKGTYKTTDGWKIEVKGNGKIKKIEK